MRTHTSGAVAAIAALLAVAAASNGEGMVANGNFESGGSGVPEGWNLEDDLRARGTVHLSRTGEGTVLELRPNSRNTQADRPFGIGQIVPADSLRGKRAILSADLKSSGGATAVIIALVLGGGRMVAQSQLAQRGGDGLERKSAEIDIPDNADRLILGCVVNGSSGSAIFDNVYLGPAAREAAAPPRTGEALNASIAVNAATVLREIPRGLFGTNLAWVWNADSMWDERAERVRPEIMRAARELGVTIVRFPSGTFADFYHWRDGVGPRRSRPSRPHGTDDNHSRHSFGTDELMEFTKALDAEAMIGVNITTGTPEEAAEWVAYCNAPNHPLRVKNGHPEPYRVRLWQIGNEQYIAEGVASTRKAHLSPEEYARRYRAFEAAMRKVDPTIKLIGIGGVNTGRYRQMANDNWTKVVLQRAAGGMDYLAVHNAYAPVGASSSGASFEEVYRAMLAFPELLSRNLAEVDRQIEAWAGPQAREIRIAVTEWGPLFHFMPNDRYVAHTKTLASGLFVAGVMQAFLKARRVEIANFFKLTDHAFMGWIGTDGTPKPSYYALQLYTKHFGTRLVASQVQTPSFDTRAVGVVDAVKQVPYLDVAASKSADGSRLYIIAVNRSFLSPVTASVQVQGFRMGARGMQHVLTGPGPDANNGNDLPNIPGLEWARQERAPGKSHFEAGRPGTVQTRSSPLAVKGPAFAYTFPPLSAVSIELHSR